jgi:hypothetical protein
VNRDRAPAAGARPAVRAYRTLAVATTRVQLWMAQGLPAAASPLQARVGALAGAAAVLWMFLVASWGVDAPFGDGHFASTAAIGVAADIMWRQHVIFPQIYYLESFPAGVAYYMHHPLGDFWVAAIFLKVFGAHNWVLRLPAILNSTLTTLFLYRFGRAAWGPLPGAVCAWAFAALPISLGFSAFLALEGPVICGLVVASWGYVRFTQTERTPYALASLLGFVYALNHDWAAYIWGAVFLSWLFLRAFILPRQAFGRFDARALGRYWALMVGAALLSLAVMFALLIETGKLSELMSMYSVRSSGSAMPLSAVLQARHVWIELMFPGLAIFLGKLALPVVMARFAIRQRDAELLPFVMFVTAIVQYLHFKQGADVHIFWPQYFAPYFGMAMGALAATLQDGLARLAPRLPAGGARILGRNSAWIGPALVALPVVFVLKDGASMIRLAQESGGRFNSPLIRTDIDRVDALRWWLPKLTPKETVAFHPGVEPVHWSLSWEMRPHPLLKQGLGDRNSRPRAFSLDSRYLPGSELRLATRTFHVEAVGPFWMIDRAAPPRPLDGYSFDEREPGPLEWMVHGGWEPMRKVRPDPFVTWEWRTVTGQPATRPTETPTTPDQLRIAHNAALAAGDTAAAGRFRAELERGLDSRPTADFDDGTRLIGVANRRGAARALDIYFLTGSKPRGRLRFAVHAKVDKPPRWSTLAWDKDVIDVDQRPVVPTDLWQPGHIYVVRAPYRKRPGTERFYGAFASIDGTRAPVRVGRVGPLDLATVD